MTTTNRTVNRILLGVIGLVAVIVGLIIGARHVPAVRNLVSGLGILPEQIIVPVAALWAIVVTCVAIIMLASVIVWTRGGGGTSTVIRQRVGDNQVAVNVTLIRDIVDHELAADRDVATAHVDVYQVRKLRPARIRVHVRRGGDALAALDAVDRAVTTLDRILGRPIPVLIHLTGGARGGRSRHSRVQ